VSESGMTMGAAHAAALEPSPYGIQSKKLTMWLFIISDAVTFGAILFGYAYLRAGTPDWPTPFQFSPGIVNGLIMTFVLLTSSLTMLAAVAAAKQGRKSSSLLWISTTVVLGIIFATLHLREWFHMFAEGWSLSKNPLGGTVMFGATFFSITGLHLTHVTCGVIALIAVGVRYKGGRYNADDIEVLGLYWHFVDLVWMFIFPLVYLMSTKI